MWKPICLSAAHLGCPAGSAQPSCPAAAPGAPGPPPPAPICSRTDVGWQTALCAPRVEMETLVETGPWLFLSWKVTSAPLKGPGCPLCFLHMGSKEDTARGESLSSKAGTALVTLALAFLFTNWKEFLQKDLPYFVSFSPVKTALLLYATLKATRAFAIGTDIMP